MERHIIDLMDHRWGTPTDDGRSMPVDLLKGYRVVGGSTILKTSHCLIETSPGVFNWSDMDWIAKECHSLNLSMAFMIHGTPTFYAIDPNSHGSWGLKGSTSGYKDINDKLNFIQAVYDRYGIKRFIDITEVNTPQWTTRTLDQLVQEWKSTYTKVNSLGAFYVSPSTSGFPSNNLIASCISNGCLDYCDAIGIMTYVSKWQMQSIRDLQSLMNEHGTPKPIHVIECGILATETGDDMKDLVDYSYNDQYDWILQTLYSLRALKVSAVYWYAWNHARCGLKFCSGALQAWRDFK
jgi:hypothetical protein